MKSLLDYINKRSSFIINDTYLKSHHYEMLCIQYENMPLHLNDIDLVDRWIAEYRIKKGV